MIIYNRKNNMLFFQHRLVCESFRLSFKIDPIYHISPGAGTKKMAYKNGLF